VSFRVALIANAIYQLTLLRETHTGVSAGEL
jgi:hypothetical protein